MLHLSPSHSKGDDTLTLCVREDHSIRTDGFISKRYFFTQESTFHFRKKIETHLNITKYQTKSFQDEKQIISGVCLFHKKRCFAPCPCFSLRPQLQWIKWCFLESSSDTTAEGSASAPFIHVI